jgi:hypothetical protein
VCRGARLTGLGQLAHATTHHRDEAAPHARDRSDRRLAPGAYELRIEVRDLVSGDRVDNAVSFTW